MSFRERIKEYPALADAYQFTEKKLNALRSDLEAALSTSGHRDKITIVTVGSYGRNEASEESDLDLYILFDSDRNPEETIADEIEAIKEVQDRHIGNSPGDTGTFGHDACIHFDDIVSNIGGEEDTNKLTTRRLLFLLEGTWLFGRERFQQYRRELLNRYIDHNDKDGKLSRFLLNDIIRYYRTITTDFEHKVTTQQKDWGLRQVKLRFSRKILYFGGIIAVAETSHLGQDQKLEGLEGWFKHAGLERIYAAGPDLRETDEVLSLYNDFLSTLSDATARQTLKQLERSTRDECELYSRLRNDSQRLSEALASWLKQRYRADHPIHHALVF